MRMRMRMRDDRLAMQQLRHCRQNERSMSGIFSSRHPLEVKCREQDAAVPE
jgi:hypothetical protein